MTSVKWLTRITAVDQPFRGYQQVKGYRFRTTEEDPGRQVTRIQPRSLMVPPGFPEFMTRDRVLPVGATRIEGKAWSGWGPIERVDISVDGGTTWQPAVLGQPASAFAWTPWSFDWEPAGPGEYELSSRAKDAAGNQQPLHPVWNVGGYENNSVQRVLVTVQEDRTGGA
jgi:DMSO/TMAO reductase YedYZ molybdopterin-dependent catalytic subunit